MHGFLTSVSNSVRWYKDYNPEDDGNVVFHSNRLILVNASRGTEGLYRMIADNPLGLAVFPGVRLKMAGKKS